MLERENPLVSWFLKNRRDFPWRKSPTPYQVWVSEIMLQQTRASVVVGYYERFMQLFPDVFALAKATVEEVIKAWEGLGYYSRARNLRLGAKEVVEKYGGALPSCREKLLAIAGIGRYTAGAILSFGFHQKSAAVDGNVLRVLSRYYRIEENIQSLKWQKQLEPMTEALLEGDVPWIAMEALIELGASVCSPKPKCAICPLRQSCTGMDVAESLPIKNKRPKTIPLKRAVCLIEAEGKVLLRKAALHEIMADLYEFPYFEIKKFLTHREVEAQVKSALHGEVKTLKRCVKVQQSFTKYRVTLYPLRMQSRGCFAVDGYEWVDLKEIKKLPFSSGHRKICEYLAS